MDSNTLMLNYARLAVAFRRGEGARLWDQDDKEYLDALSGIAVCGLGHAHPSVTEAICQQASNLVHTSNLYRIPLQEQLAERLCALARMESAFFCNSGAEANEAALKIARLYGHSRGIEQPAVIVMEDSFHGRTLATLSATGNRRVQAGFEPLVQGFVRAPFNDLQALETIAANARNVAAVLVEPIQGEGGIRIPTTDYLAGLRELCDRQGWLLMLDEVQTGIARTGAWFAHQHSGIRADVMTLAKALGNGVPIGACLASGPAAQQFRPGNHGTTFGGNPLACAAALAVLDTIENEHLVERAASAGMALKTALAVGLQAHAGVADIRGQGLMLGIELRRDCTALVGRALAAGLLINVTAGRVVRLLPPLIISDAQIAWLAETLTGLIIEFLDEDEKVATA